MSDENVVPFKGLPPPPARKPPELPPSGGDGGNVTELRISRLEAKMDKVDERLGKLEVAVAILTERVAHLPSKGFIVGSTLTALAFLTALIVFSDRIKVAFGV